MVKKLWNCKDFNHKIYLEKIGKTVTGSYQVALPDGRIQTVTYTADHYNGFVADVTYEGEAHYPEDKPYHPAPSYKPAPAYKPAPYHA